MNIGVPFIRLKHLMYVFFINYVLFIICVSNNWMWCAFIFLCIKVWLPTLFFKKRINLPIRTITAMCWECSFSPLFPFWTYHTLNRSDIYELIPKPASNFPDDNGIWIEINNLYFQHHDDRGWNKIPHSILKLANTKLYESHINKTNNLGKGCGIMAENQAFLQPILNGLSIKIPPHQLVTITGKNGCGKTTLLKIMGKILKGYDGQIKIYGKDLKEIDIKDFYERMAVLPQFIDPLELSVKEFLSYQDSDIKYQEYICKYLDINLNDNIAALSGGKAQLVNIAFSLISNKEMMLLDEPTSHLDYEMQFKVLKLLRHLVDVHQKSIIMILHNQKQAKQYSDCIITIKNGKAFKI